MGHLKLAIKKGVFDPPLVNPRNIDSIIVILGGERVSIREYPRSKEGGRENLEGESRGSAAHERFSREILPTDRLSEGIFRILTSETPVYY